jgi:hypothetical protein
MRGNVWRYYSILAEEFVVEVGREHLPTILANPF